MSKTNRQAQERKKRAMKNQDLPGFDLGQSKEDLALEKDWYPTPKEALTVILPYLDKTLRIWEPCAGDRRLIRWLSEAGFEADGGDIRDTPPCDFLKDSTRRECDLTNPPFSLAQEIIDHALAHAGEVWMLLPLGFLGAQKRAEWWKTNEAQAHFVLSNRPDFTGQGGDSSEYAWYFWGARQFPDPRTGKPRQGMFHV